MKGIRPKVKLLLLSTLFLLFTGCFKTPEQKLESAIKKTGELNSAHVEINMNIGVKSEGIGLEIPITMFGDFNNESKLSKMNLAISLFGMEVTTEMYTDSRDENNSISYTKEDDVWIKSTESILIDEDKTIEFVSVEEQETTENEYFYKATIAQADFEEALTQFELEDLDVGAYKFTSDIVIDIYVDKDTGYITKVYTDLKDIVSYEIEPVDGEEAVETEITAFDIEIILSKFNETKVEEIPNEIIENAVDEEIMEVQTYAYDYISAVEWEVWDYEEVSTYNSTDLEYDGPKPELVDLTLEYGTVVSGTIKINGYTMTITEGEVSVPVK